MGLYGGYLGRDTKSHRVSADVSSQIRAHLHSNMFLAVAGSGPHFGIRNVHGKPSCLLTEADANLHVHEIAETLVSKVAASGCYKATEPCVVPNTDRSKAIVSIPQNPVSRQLALEVAIVFKRRIF